MRERLKAVATALIVTSGMFLLGLWFDHWQMRSRPAHFAQPEHDFEFKVLGVQFVPASGSSPEHFLYAGITRAEESVSGCSRRMLVPNQVWKASQIVMCDG